MPMRMRSPARVTRARSTRQRQRVPEDHRPHDMIPQAQRNPRIARAKPKRGTFRTTNKQTTNRRSGTSSLTLCTLPPPAMLRCTSVRDSIHTIHVHGPGTSPPPRLAPQQSRLYMPSKGLGGYAVGGAARLDLVAFPLPHHQSRHVATRLTRRGYVGPPQATTGVGWVTEVGDCCCWLAR